MNERETKIKYTHTYIAEGPQAMLRGAVLYGGMIYMFSGGMGTKRPLHFEEKAVDF
jgi:hypothetical protein